MSDPFNPNDFSTVNIDSPFDPDYYSLEKNLARSMGLQDTAQPDIAPSTIADIFSRRADLRQDKKNLLEDFQDLSQERTRTSFVNPEAGQKGFLSALKDPTEAQRNAFIAFGLGLAGSTGDLSQRLAAGLGQGVGALQKTREQEKARELQGLQFQMKELGLEGEDLTQQLEQQKYLNTLDKQARTEQREETRLGLEERRLATSEFQAMPKVDQYQQLIDRAIDEQDYTKAARYQRLQEQELYGEPNKVAQINDQIDRLNTQLQSLDPNDPGYQQQRDRIQRRISDQESLKAKQTYISGGTTLNPDGSVTFGGPRQQQKTAQFDLDTVTGMTGRALVDLPSILVDPYFQSSTGPIAQAKFLPVVQLFGETGGKELRERIGLYSDERGVEKTEFFKPLSEKEWPIARRMLAINPKLPAAANINIQVKTHAPKGLEQIQNAYTRTQNDLYGIQARMSVAQQMAIPFINGHGQDPRNPFAGGLDISPEGANASTKDLDKFFPTADSSAKGQGYLVKTVNGQKRLFPQEYVQSIYNRQMNSSNPGDFIMLGGKRVTNIPYEFYVKNFGYSEY